MPNNCISCGDIIPEGRQICWRCEHNEPTVKSKPLFADILAANKFCRFAGWASYKIEYIAGHGYTCEEIK